MKSELEAEKTKVATMQDASSEVHELEKENSRLQDEVCPLRMSITYV